MAKESENPKGAETDPKVTMIDLSTVETRRKSMLDACLIIYHGEYVAETSALAVPLIIQAAKSDGLANNKPIAFEVGAIEGKPGAVALFPRDLQSEQYLKANWFDGGGRCRMDFQRLMALLKFEIPRKTYAVIPVKAGSYGKRACIEVHFGDAEFQAIEEGKRKKSAKAEAEKKAAAQGKEQVAPGKEQPAPAKELAKAADTPSGAAD